MNRQITKLAVASMILLAALIVGTTYWQTWASAGLAEKQDNAIQRVAQFRIKRGLIRAADGTILATNVKRKVDGQTLYFRRYPTGRLFANLVGYSTQGRSRAGLEQSENAYLTSSNANLSTIFNKTLDKIKGVTITGNDLVLSSRPNRPSTTPATASSTGSRSRTPRAPTGRSSPSGTPRSRRVSSTRSTRSSATSARRSAPEPSSST